MEMHSDSVCRLCLSVEADNKMLSLTPVQEWYEKVTNNRLHTNKMPVTVCYICYTQLKRSYKFMVKSTIAENTLIEILNTQTEITPKSVCSISRDAKGLTNCLSVTMVKHENFPPNIPILVKSEIIEQEDIDIKVEIDEDMTYSHAEDYGDNSEEDNVPLQCIKDESPAKQSYEIQQFDVKPASLYGQLEEDFYIEVPEGVNAEPGKVSFLNTANIPASSCYAEVSLPLKGDVEIEEGNHKGDPDGTEQFEDNTTAIKRKPSLERIVIESYTGEKPFKCEICNRSYCKKSTLVRHERMHTGEKPFECEICNRSYTKKSSLVRHVRTHTGENLFECKTCNRNYPNKSSLVNHSRTHTGEKPYECEICSCKFALKSILTRHLRLHTGEKAFECKFCNRSFSQKSTLVGHLRTHTGEKPFECKICNCRFSKKSILVMHTRTHTGEKPFVCKICNRSFVNKPNLVRHLRTHSGEKPFECKTCSRSFSEKTTLVKHMRIHTGEKPFECDICKRSFFDKSNLVRHLRTHTDEKPFECTFCQRKFASKRLLKSHLKTHSSGKCAQLKQGVQLQ